MGWSGKAGVPCTDDPRMWDLDQGGVDEWATAVAICRGCPRLGACLGELAALEEPPVGAIWAGIPFSKRGEPMTLSSGGQLRIRREQVAA